MIDFSDVEVGDYLLHQRIDGEGEDLEDGTVYQVTRLSVPGSSHARTIGIRGFYKPLDKVNDRLGAWIPGNWTKLTPPLFNKGDLISGCGLKGHFEEYFLDARGRFAMLTSKWATIYPGKNSPSDEQPFSRFELAQAASKGCGCGSLTCTGENSFGCWTPYMTGKVRL